MFIHPRVFGLDYLVREPEALCGVCVGLAQNPQASRSNHQDPHSSHIRAAPIRTTLSCCLLPFGNFSFLWSQTLQSPKHISPCPSICCSFNFFEVLISNWAAVVLIPLGQRALLWSSPLPPKIPSDWRAALVTFSQPCWSAQLFPNHQFWDYEALAELHS